MIIRIVVIFLSVFLVPPGLKAQTIEKWIETNEKAPVEKIYLHTDREAYFSDETIWFKVYLTDSRSGRLIPGAENIYVNLLDESGSKVTQTTLMSVNGQVPGHLYLPDTLKQGNYLLQAFTDYLLNFDEASFFHQPITILRPAASLRAIESRQRTQQARRMVADVSFLPEGGKLLTGISNLVAFKAVDSSGSGINARGSVRDESGNEVITFQTDYKGMGIFFLTPLPGKKYNATINGFPSFRFDFSSLIADEGIKIQLVNQTSRDFIVNISGNTDRFAGEPFYLLNVYRGQTIFYQPFKMEGMNHLLKFDSDMLKGGINQLVLLDKNLTPLSERLLFSENIKLNRLQITPGKDTFPLRSEVKLLISEAENRNETSNLSVSVVHEAAFSEKGSTQNILTEMLISSELKGYIETPTDFFMDTEISAQTKQRLLMLTNGWSSYFWNSAPLSSDSMKHRQMAGLELHGIASDIVSGQPLKKGEITLVIEKDREMAFLTQETGGKGEFRFTGLLFNDTATVYVQAKTARGKQNTEITLLPAFTAPPSLPNLQALKEINTMPAELEILKYDQNRLYDTYLRQTGAFSTSRDTQQEEFQITADGHFRIYDRPDHVVKVPETEASFGNILDFLAGKVAGLDISNDQISIRGTSNMDGNSSPLFLIDGVPIITSNFSVFSDHIENGNEPQPTGNQAMDKVKSIPLGDIDKIEILKSPQNLALFGSEGSNGVIAIYTRKPKSRIPSIMVRGVLDQKIAGYASFRKFYAPKYLPENRWSEAPDHRNTLYWDPEVILENGETDLSFYTSDQPGIYIVTVEGISESGYICLGTTEFEVKENLADPQP